MRRTRLFLDTAVIPLALFEPSFERDPLRLVPTHFSVITVSHVLHSAQALMTQFVSGTYEGFTASLAICVADIMEAAIKALSKLGMVCVWATDLVLKEIEYFHFHGTGRPPENPQVQSLDLVPQLS